MRRTLALALCVGALLWASSATAAIAFVAKAAGQTTGSCTGGNITTTGVDTSTATLLVAVTSLNDAATAPTDSNSNTWVASVARTDAIFTTTYYVKNPTVGASHTFSLSNANRCAGLAVLAFSGTDTTAPLDVTNSAHGSSVTSLASGTTGTLADANEVVVTFVTGNDSGTLTQPTGYTAGDLQAFSPGVAYGAASAYKLKSSDTSAENPSWSWNGGAASAVDALVLTFKPSGGGGGPAGCKNGLLMQGVGCEDQP